jgi:hypothetical protein
MKWTLHKRYNYYNKLNVPSIDLKGKRGKGGEGGQGQKFIKGICFGRLLYQVNALF